MKIKNISTLDTLIAKYPQLKLTITGILPEFGNLEQAQLRERFSPPQLWNILPAKPEWRFLI